MATVRHRTAKLDDLRAAGRPAEFAAWLSDEERARWQRFTHAGAAELFVCARGVTRELIADLAQVPPHTIEIGNDPLGRPFIAGHGVAAAWHISLSHTQGLVGAAASREAVGIDVQWTGGGHDLVGIGKRVFTVNEQRELAELATSAARHRRFFTLWTAKEAWMKARGMGFRLPPQSCDLAVVDDAVVVRGFAPEAKDDPGAWQLQSWWPTDQHAAAIASIARSRC